jgi:hypothetical protein
MSDSTFFPSLVNDGRRARAPGSSSRDDPADQITLAGVTMNNVADEPITDARALPYRHIDRHSCKPLSYFVLYMKSAVATGAGRVPSAWERRIVRQALSGTLFKTAQVTIDHLRGPARLAAQWAEEERKASETD